MNEKNPTNPTKVSPEPVEISPVATDKELSDWGSDELPPEDQRTIQELDQAIPPEESDLIPDLSEEELKSEEVQLPEELALEEPGEKSIEDLQKELEASQEREKKLQDRLSQRGRELQTLEVQFAKESEQANQLSVSQWQQTARLAGRELVTALDNIASADPDTGIDREAILGAAIMNALTHAQTYYTGHVQNLLKTAHDREDRFLEKFPEYQEVRDSFDDFLRDLDQEPITIKRDPQKLLKFYQMHLRLAKSDPQKIDEIKTGNQKMIQHLAARKKAAAKPVQSKRTVVDKSQGQKDDEEIFSTYGVRYDPSPYVIGHL